MNEIILKGICGVVSICGFGLLWRQMTKTEREIDDTARWIEESRKVIERDTQHVIDTTKAIPGALKKSDFDEYLEELKKEFNVEGP